LETNSRAESQRASPNLPRDTVRSPERCTPASGEGSGHRNALFGLVIDPDDVPRILRPPLGFTVTSRPGPGADESSTTSHPWASSTSASRASVGMRAGGSGHRLAATRLTRARGAHPPGAFFDPP